MRPREDTNVLFEFFEFQHTFKSTQRDWIKNVFINYIPESIESKFFFKKISKTNRGQISRFWWSTNNRR